VADGTFWRKKERKNRADGARGPKNKWTSAKPVARGGLARAESRGLWTSRSLRTRARRLGEAFSAHYICEVEALRRGRVARGGEPCDRDPKAAASCPRGREKENWKEWKEKTTSNASCWRRGWEAQEGGGGRGEPSQPVFQDAGAPSQVLKGRWAGLAKPILFHVERLGVPR